MRSLLTHLLLILLATALPAFAQEASPQSEETVPAESEADADADAAVADGDEPDAETDDEDEPDIDLDDPAFADLDEQNYEEPEDDFIPTEEIPADQAIPFPTDI